MIQVSNISNEAPITFGNNLQKAVYEMFSTLGIRFERVETDEVITMEDCAAINDRLGIKLVKTLFLANRQQTEFYLFVTEGDKPFRSKDFSHALGIARVSFAPAEKMQEMAHTVIGAATALSAILDKEHLFSVVLDKAVLESDTYGCSDGTTTSYLKLRTTDLVRLLVACGHTPKVIEV